MFSSENKRMFQDLMAALSETNRGQLKFKANGGNTLLFVYPPNEEQQYIDKARDLLTESEFDFIDIRKILITFIDELEVENLDRYFDALKMSTDQIFKADDDRTDFYDMIITEIEKTYKSNKTPVLIHTGSLHGTGVDNLHIMENKIIMSSTIPLIVFYPASHDGDKLMFLNFKSSSKYRCHIIM